MKTITIGLLGAGTVGSGVLALLRENATILEKQTGCRFEVLRILVRDSSRLRPGISDGQLTTDGFAIVNDPAVQVVIEVMGGMEPASSLIRGALQSGKHVITANKELIAKAGHELLPFAHKNNVALLYEASVAGSIPILHNLQHTLAGNRIEKVIGIVNGTTNFMLSLIESVGKEHAGQAYTHALSEAQRLGYAEANPTSDVEGYDAQYKIAILAGLAFKTFVPLESVHREGISHITERDMEWAHSLEHTIKLLGIVQRESGGKISVRVHPALVPFDHPLSRVSGAMNAVWLTGNGFGQMLFQGPGAGSLPTASAIIGDLIQVARCIQSNTITHLPPLPAGFQESIPIEQSENVYFVHCLMSNPSKAFAEVASEMERHGVNISRVQFAPLPADNEQERAEFAWMTQPIEEGKFMSALQAIQTLPDVIAVHSPLRVLSV
jgi:homoserine dehydrogenase